MKFPSKIFFTADTHFGHDAIRIHCERPWKTVEEMDEALIDNWNNTITRGATIFHLGDFAFKNHEYYLKRLKGSKILIMGNHDSMNQKCKSYFKEIHNLLERRFNRQEVTLCHYRMMTWNKSNYGTWHLYGHSHSRMQEGDSLCFDVGVDAWDYSPIPYELIEYKMNLLKLTQKKQYRKNYAKQTKHNNQIIKQNFLVTNKV